MATKLGRELLPEMLINWVAINFNKRYLIHRW
jgi:hypothetical protein